MGRVLKMTTKTTFKYILRNRPYAYSHMPNGDIGHEDHPVWRWGMVCYDHPLDEAQIKSYELIPVASYEQIAKALAEKFARYLDEYLELLATYPQRFCNEITDKYKYSMGYPEKDSLDFIVLEAEVIRILKAKHGGNNE